MAATDAAGVPEVGAPEVGVPEVGAPVVGAPEVAAQEVGAPEVGAPEVGVPEVGAPEVGAPEVGAPEVGAPEVGAPEVGAPEVGVPEVGVPEVGAPEVGVPEVGVPEVGAPEVGARADDRSHRVHRIRCHPQPRHPHLVARVAQDIASIEADHEHHRRPQPGTTRLRSGQRASHTQPITRSLRAWVVVHGAAHVVPLAEAVPEPATLMVAGREVGADKLVTPLEASRRSHDSSPVSDIPAVTARPMSSSAHDAFALMSG